MKIMDTYEKIKEFYQQCNGNFNYELWEAYIHQISPNLKEKLLEDGYDYQTQVLPVLNSALLQEDKLEELHDSFVEVTKCLEDNIKAKLNIHFEVDIILYFGFCNGAGWATTLDHRHVVLLGVEKMIELDWCSKHDMIALIYHELGHIWHDMVGVLEIPTSTHKERFLWQLYQEGIAMYIEQILCDDFNYYHQNKQGWLDWCHNHKQELFREYLRRIDENESCQDFFGDWCEYQGHSDIGYYLGCELIKGLVSKYDLVALANFSIDTIYQELKLLIEGEKYYD